jgi:hypothetical protein
MGVLKGTPGRRRWTVAPAVALALSFCVPQALGAGSGPEAEPGGPPACSMLPRSAAPGGLRVDLWIQCNYHVREVMVKSDNRRLTSFSTSPELVGAGAGDTMSCRRKSPTRAECQGGLMALARIHAQLGVDEGICDTPRLRLSVYTFGGPTCEGLCPQVGFSNWTVNSTDRRSLGCHGGK